MYIDPFVAGILATLFAEAVALIGVAVYGEFFRKGKK